MSRIGRCSSGLESKLGRKRLRYLTHSASMCERYARFLISVYLDMRAKSTVEDPKKS
jgi:hypothetical protein